MHWAPRDEIFHIRQRDSSDSFSLQGEPQATANIDRILGPFLPAASAIVGQMQSPIRVFVDGQTQPTRHIDGVGRRRKFVGYSRDYIVFASTLNVLINKARFIRSEDPGKTNYQMLRRDLQDATFPLQLRFAIRAQRNRFIFFTIGIRFLAIKNVIGPEVNYFGRFLVSYLDEHPRLPGLDSK